MGSRHIKGEASSPDNRWQIGGNAFPEAGSNSPGMSALDYFAASAMQALVTHKGNDAHYHSDLATDAYNIGAAMLTERDKRNKPEPGELR